MATFPGAFADLEPFASWALPSEREPDDASRLLWLCYSLVNISFPVEVWRQPRVPDSGAAVLELVIEPVV
jgi:hypothetical protein